MNLMELGKILYGISMDSVFMSRPENSMMINNLVSTVQSIENAAAIIRNDMRNDNYKMTMNSKISELENALVTSITQRLFEHGIPIMNSYSQPMMQNSQYGQPMHQQQYGQPMMQQPQYGQPMQQQPQYGQPMQQQPQYGQPMQQQPQYGQPMQQQPQYGQPMQQQPQQQQAATPPPPSSPSPQPEPPRKSSAGPIAFGDEPAPAPKSSTSDKKLSTSSGAGVFGMDGGTLPGAKKGGNEPPGSAAGRDFLLSLLEKQ